MSDATKTSPELDALVQLSFAVQLVLTRVAAEFDLSVTQLRVLGILRDRTPTMARIADFLQLDRSSVSGLIDRAERRDLVVRRASDQDARMTLVDLTAHGRSVGADIAKMVERELGGMLEHAQQTDLAGVVRIVEQLET